MTRSDWDNASGRGRAHAYRGMNKDGKITFTFLETVFCGGPCL